MRESSPPQTCHVSRVTCHVSHVTCHMLFFLVGGGDKVVKLIGGGSVINGAYPVTLFFCIGGQYRPRVYSISEKVNENERNTLHL